MLRLREEAGKGEPLELAVTEQLHLAGIEDIDHAVILLGFYLVGLRCDRHDEPRTVAGQDDFPLACTASHEIRAEVVDLVP